jgi:hypothetical protein
MLFDVPVLEPMQDLPASNLWWFLPFGYLFTIVIETPILLLGLSNKLTFKQKLMCGIWLTACTYPVVVLVLPMLLADFSWFVYIVTAEIFAPVGECVFFWLAFRGSKNLETDDWIRCFVVIIFANLASFGFGEIMHYYQWFGLF